MHLFGTAVSGSHALLDPRPPLQQRYSLIAGVPHRPRASSGLLLSVGSSPPFTATSGLPRTPFTRLRHFDRLLRQKKSEPCLSGTAPTSSSPRPRLTGPCPKSREDRCASVFCGQLTLAAVNCRCRRNWSCCRGRARPPPLRRATASSLALLIHLSLGAAAATVPGPSAASLGDRFAGHSRSPAADSAPLSLTSSSLQIVCSLPVLARDPPPHSLAGVEDDKKETRVTLPGGIGPLTSG